MDGGDGCTTREQVMMMMIEVRNGRWQRDVHSSCIMLQAWASARFSYQVSCTLSLSAQEQRESARADGPGVAVGELQRVELPQELR